MNTANRPIITKYFSSNNWKYFNTGTVWFGTLESYRAIERKQGVEQKQARFSDSREGVVEHSYQIPGGYIESFQHPGISITNSYFDGPNAIMMATGLNELVFCSSFGAFDSQHARNLRDGARSEGGVIYEGNPELDCFVEIDLLLFIDAIWGTARKSERWNTTLERDEVILKQRVYYGDTRRQIHVGRRHHSTGEEVTLEDYLRTLFTKPEKFSAENEFRIVLRLNAPETLGNGEAGMLLSSAKIRRSFKRMGRFKGGLTPTNQADVPE